MAAGMYWAAEDAALICGGLECLEAEESGGVQTQKCYTFNPQDGQWRETFELDVRNSNSNFEMHINNPNKFTVSP